MAKLFAIFIFAAAITAFPWAGAGAAAPAGCSRDLPPIPAALHSLITRAEKLGETGNARGAADLLSDYLDAHPQETHPYPFYDAGYFLKQAGRPDLAVGYVQKAVSLNPCFGEAWQFLGALYQTAGQLDQAAMALEKAADILKDPDVRYQAAILFLQAHEPEKVLEALKPLYTARPQKAEWHLAAARAHEAREAHVEAAEAMASAHALSGDPEQLYQCAVFWLRAEKPARALPLLKQLTKTGAPKSHWLVALSNALKALKNKEETAEAMERAARISRDPKLSFHAAWLWLEADRPKKALPLLEKLAARKYPRVDWLLALANTYVILDQPGSAAMTMDRVVRMDPKPEYLYNAGVLWLHAGHPQKALSHLLSLCERTPAKAQWFVALAHAWFAKKEMVNAAGAMERAADLSKRPEYAYEAGLMWLQAKAADAALRVLVPLSRISHPEADWLAALSHAWVLKGEFVQAAEAMERAARITGNGAHYYRAGMLWLQTGKRTKGISLLRICIKKEPVKQDWLVGLAQALVAVGREGEALTVMAQTRLTVARPAAGLRFQGAMLWRRLKRPRKALPILRVLCACANPDREWLVTLVKTRVELGRMKGAEKALKRLIDHYPETPEVWRLAAWVALQQADYTKAAGAMAVAVRLGPAGPDLLKELADLYHMAGAPVKAGAALQKVWKGHPTPADRDRLVNTYLSGHRYDLALPFAVSAAEAEPTADRWETVGAIFFRLRKFKESHDAYCRSAELGPDADLRLKAGYAALKMDHLEEASRLFQEALDRSENNGPVPQEARRNLAFTKKMALFHEKDAAPSPFGGQGRPGCRADDTGPHVF